MINNKVPAFIREKVSNLNDTLLDKINKTNKLYKVYFIHIIHSHDFNIKGFKSGVELYGLKDYIDKKYKKHSIGSIVEYNKDKIKLLYKEELDYGLIRDYIDKSIREYTNFNNIFESDKSINENVSIYNSSSYNKCINFNSLLKYKNVIIGEIHQLKMVEIYDKLLSIFKPDFFVCEFADEARIYTREELKDKLDNARDYTDKPKSDDNISCINGYNDWCYKLAYKYDVPLIGCNPSDGKKFRSMNDEDVYRESYMLKTINEFTSKGKCLIQLGDHHLRSIPFDIDFLKFSNQDSDDRGLYKNIDDLVVSNASPIWMKYYNRPDTIIYRVDNEYNTEIAYLKNKSSVNESYIIETTSKIDPNFKKKSGKQFDYICIKDNKAKKYLEKDSYYNKNFKNYNIKFTGEIAIDKELDKLAGYIYIGDKGTKNEGFCQTLEVKKEYRGYGISNKLIEDGISKYNMIDLLVDKTNEVAIELYKKHDFVIIKWDNKKQYWMKLKSKLSKNDEVVNESYIINEPDIYYNKEKFDNGEINLCFITGHSGSGKSTMGRDMQNKENIEHYELDDLLCTKDSFTMENLKEYGDLIYSFFKGPGKKYYVTFEELKNSKLNEDSYERPLFRDFVYYAMKYAKLHKDRKYVLEGVWLFGANRITENDSWFKPEEFKDYAFYIKGTSLLISKIRGAKRDSSDAKNKLDRIKSAISIFSKNWKWYFLDEKQIKKFRDYFKNK